MQQGVCLGAFCDYLRKWSRIRVHNQNCLPRFCPYQPPTCHWTSVRWKSPHQGDLSRQPTMCPRPRPVQPQLQHSQPPLTRTQNPRVALQTQTAQNAWVASLAVPARLVHLPLETSWIQWHSVFRWPQLVRGINRRCECTL